MIVFISHSSSDYLTAAAISHALEERQIATWFAPRDIRGGDDYARVIPSAVASSRAMVVLLSAKAMDSLDVQSEVALARRNGLALVPLTLPGCPDPLADPAWDYRLIGAQLSTYRSAAAVVPLVQEKLRVRASTPSQLRLPERPNAASSTWNVVLTHTGDRKIAVIKAVRELTNLGLKEAKDLVEGAPAVVLKGAATTLAQTAKENLEQSGATVMLRPVGAPDASGGSQPNTRADTASSHWDVILTYAGDKKIAVIKAVRELTNLGLKEAKDLVEGAPAVVLKGANTTLAQTAKENLEQSGATVVVRSTAIGLFEDRPSLGL